MSSHPLVFLPLFLFFSFMKSNGDNHNSFSLHCPDHTCGNIKVRYPFWLLDNTTSRQYCGYPGLGLNCSISGDLIIQLRNDPFYIRHINYENYTLTLVDAHVRNITCPRPRHNITIENLPLGYSRLDANLTFYFNCTSPPANGTPVECLRSYGDRQSYVFLGGTEPGGYNWFEYCVEKVVTTVMEFSMLSGLGQAMNEGFVLDWRRAGECGRCEDSDGRCGYINATEKFMCFCLDDTIQNRHCKGDEVNLHRKIIVGTVAATASALVMWLIFFIYLRRKKNLNAASVLNSRDGSSYPSITDLEKAGNYHGVNIFTYSELEEATNNFDIEKELGDGGFGTVYQGKLRDGRIVAVKRLYENNYKRVGQFMNEVEILTHLRHQNLVTLYGCTSHHCRELVLVYEYIPNGTVADHLHGEHAKPGSLTWPTRLSIAIETASALAYLHASDVIHRDVKTNNILLDNNFGVKVADFGLSRLFPTDATHVSTAPQGTPGYVDPEYHECYQLTDKSDVYSFGVVLIELISSKPAVDITRHRHEINLSNMAILKIQNHALHELVDPCFSFESDCMVREMITDVAELAFQCLQNGKEMRPSMEKVLEVLKGIQSKGYGIPEVGEIDTPADDVVLLKTKPRTPSVTSNWVSSFTTPNISE